jgi:hypothetical protein
LLCSQPPGRAAWPETIMVQSTRETPPIAEPSSPPDYRQVDVEVDAWAKRERARRHAWLEGPTELEKTRARLHLLERMNAGDRSTPLDPGLVDAEIELWARRENARRADWAAGPNAVPVGTSREQMLRELLIDDLSGPPCDSFFRNLMNSEYAVRGLWERLITSSLQYYDELVREGRRAACRTERIRRVPF